LNFLYIMTGGVTAHGSSHGRRADHVMLFRHGKASLTERVFDQGVGGDVDLPIVLVVAELTNCQHRTGQVKVRISTLGAGSVITLGIFASPCLQDRDRFHNLDAKGD